ncbi:MAG TPA: UDP-N-acetylmuramoyl-tripeptide--D-alanyl-D-alanine ligase [Candidatus Nanopelagicaceae bacterium]
MIELTAGEIASIVHGELHAPPSLLIKSPASFDSRDVIAGGIFIALKGEHRDGHEFAGEALHNGVVLVISARVIDGPCIVVADVLVALALLAEYVRRVLTNMIVIGITGSQGKTTTKDLMAWILALHGETVATHASFNNELGLPITLLHCSESTRFCILEMGARHPGDIAALCSIASPDIGVVLKVGTAHLGEFGTLAAIAATKAELIQGVHRGGIAILGQYDEFTPKMAEGRDLSLLTFGETHEADIRATDVEIREGRSHFDLVTPEGRAAVGMRLIGAHQIPNALAAAAVATALHVPLEVIASGLSTAEIQSKWRMELHELRDLLLINDAYNSNPESTAAALKTLSLFAQERGGQSWAFLGKMHELGGSSSEEHALVGTLAESMGIDHLVAVGADQYGLHLSPDSDLNIHYCQTQVEALDLVEHFAPGDVVLVKASRAEKMEELAQEIERVWNEREGLNE